MSAKNPGVHGVGQGSTGTWIRKRSWSASWMGSASSGERAVLAGAPRALGRSAGPLAAHHPPAPSECEVRAGGLAEVLAR